MEASVQHNLDAWNSAFAEYVKVTSKSPQDALEHKVQALGVALYRGFSGHKLAKGAAWIGLTERTSAHVGTKIRGTLMAEYMANRAILRAKAKAIKHSMRWGTLDQVVGGDSALSANQAERINLWQSIVGREVGARQSGAGVLAAAFLWFRNRGKGKNRHLVLNRRGKRIGGVEIQDGQAVITGEQDGLVTVDNRYGIVDAAVAEETADTMKYVKDKQDQTAAEMVRKLIG